MISWIFPFLAFGQAQPAAPAALFGADFSDLQAVWTSDLGEAPAGQPLPFGSGEAAEGILVTLGSGRLVLLGPQGEKLRTMTLDLPADSPAVAGDLRGRGRPAIIAIDVSGSVTCFDERGDRAWKFERRSKARDFRLPILADLDGDGRLEIILTDCRGQLYCLDAEGRLRLEATSGSYRVSTPAAGDLDRDGQPELIFGTDAGDVHCIDARGGLLWSVRLEGRFGRSLPLVADADRDGRYEAYLPISFVGATRGLLALEAASGALLWRAPSVLQSYRSTVIADLDGDGRNEILFGDKNTRLYCLDDRGEKRWSVQLGGRGLFFAPAAADLEGNGRSAIFAAVRGAGLDGKSLYVLDASGRLLGALSLPGGGGGSHKR